MGSSHSKSRIATYPVSEKNKTRSDSKLSDLSVRDGDADSEVEPSISLRLSSVVKWEEKLFADPKVSPPILRCLAVTNSYLEPARAFCTYHTCCHGHLAEAVGAVERYTHFQRQDRARGFTCDKSAVLREMLDICRRQHLPCGFDQEV